MLKDGTVVTWGSKDYGGDSNNVQVKLRGVDAISSTEYAFAAVLKNEGRFFFNKIQRHIILI